MKLEEPGRPISWDGRAGIWPTTLSCAPALSELKPTAHLRSLVWDVLVLHFSNNMYIRVGTRIELNPSYEVNYNMSVDYKLKNLLKIYALCVIISWNKAFSSAEGGMAKQDLPTLFIGQKSIWMCNHGVWEFFVCLFFGLSNDLIIFPWVVWLVPPCALIFPSRNIQKLQSSKVGLEWLLLSIFKYSEFPGWNYESLKYKDVKRGIWQALLYDASTSS